MYTTCYIKNIDTVSHTWVGTLLTAGQEYQIPDNERLRWMADDDVISAITADEAQIGNGDSYITGYSDQVDWLKSNTMNVNGITPKGTLSLPEIAVHKPEGNSYAFTSHDFADPCSWFGDSERVTGETLTLDSGKTYDSANTNWIDLSHGRKYQEDLISSSYLPAIYDNGTELTEGTDYTIDYKNGKVTFDADYTITGPITADYSYANGSTFYVLPSTSVTKFIEHTELQVSKNVDITDSIVFEIWVYNPADLPNKILYEKISYKNAKDYINGCNLGQGYIPAFGGTSRGISDDVIVFPFNYASMTPLTSSTGAEIRVKLENDTALGTTNSNPAWGTVTFYVLEEEL